MTIRQLLFAAIAAEIFAWGAPQPVHASPDAATFSTITIPGATGSIFPRAINDRRDIVGFYLGIDPANPGQPITSHGFLRQQGVLRVIDPPNSLSTVINGINNRGDIVGAYTTDNEVWHGFVLQQNVFTRFDAPGDGGFEGDMTTLGLINDRGDIIGFGLGRHGFNGYFTLQHGVFNGVSFPFNANPLGLNNSGDIVGYYTDANGFTTHGFVLRNGVFTTVDKPGANSTLLRGLNDHGEIVGSYFDGNFHGFLLRGDAFTPLDVPVGVATDPWGMNNGGQVVGDYLVQLGASFFQGFYRN